MSTTSRIIINRFEDKISVPIEAVFRNEGKTVLWEANGSDWEMRDVVLGERNDNFVVIDSGIKEGAKIALIDPNVAADERISSSQSLDDSISGGSSAAQETKPTKRPKRRHRRG